MRKLLLTILPVLLLAASAFGQSRQVTGVVSGADGSPIAGVTVMVEGASGGAATGLDGRYTISAPADGSLTFSFIGLETQTVAVAGRAIVNVTMAEVSERIDDVLVIAYGTASREAFTGSASQIKAEDIERRQGSNITTALAGQVAGLQMTQSSGQPGSTSSLRIRGFGSINASATPLYVIDGVPYTGDITGLNPADVESITVLKDAASNSLYGARGANGVVMITTKRGRTGDAVVTVDAKWGVNTRAVPDYDILTTSDKDLRSYYETYRLGQQNAYGGSYSAEEIDDFVIEDLVYQVFTPPTGEGLFVNGKINPNATLGYWNEGAQRYLTPDDWSKASFNNALRQEYNASVAGASDKINYFFSTGYLNDKGYAVNSNFDRISARLKADYQARKWLRLTANASYSNVTANSPQTTDRQGTSSMNMFYFTRHLAPIYPLYQRGKEGDILVDIRGDKMYDYGDIAGLARPFITGNPVQAQYLDKEFRVVDLLSLRSGAEITFVKGVKGVFNVGYDLDNTRMQSMGNPYYGQSGGSGGSMVVEASRGSTLNLQQLLTWAQACGKHNWDVMLGHEYYKQPSVGVWALGYNLFNPDVLEVDNTLNDDSRKGGSSGSEYFTEGYFGRVQYDYDGKYFFSGSYRRDASSRFAPENRWGNFWSVGASWLLSREDFLQDIEWVSMLKLKSSYGTQGNDGLLNSGGTAHSYYPYANIYTQSNVAGVFGVSRTSVGNRDISWEDNQNFNAGVEFSLFKDKLSGSFEYFVRTTRDMLFYRPVPASIGYSSYPDNIGDMRNAGYEIDLQYTPVQTEELNWSIYANATHVKNRVLSLPPESRELGIPSSQFRYMEGHSIYDYYMREWAGVDDQGKATWWKYADDDTRTATATYTEATERFVGKSSIPKLYGGFGTSVYWKGFDASIAFTYQLGGWGLDQEYSRLMHTGNSRSLGNNWHRDILDAWSPTNTGSDIPQVDALDLYGNNVLTSRFLIKNDFLNLQNVTVGYTLPERWVKKLDISSVRVYAVADNVWLFSKRKGYDPRGGFAGTSNLNYGIIRTISGGVTFKF